MDKTRETSVPHIIFRRGKNAGEYLPDISYADGSSTSTKRRHSYAPGSIAQSNALPTLASVLARQARRSSTSTWRKSSQSVRGSPRRSLPQTRRMDPKNDTELVQPTIPVFVQEDAANSLPEISHRTVGLSSPHRDVTVSPSFAIGGEDTIRGVMPHAGPSKIASSTPRRSHVIVKSFEDVDAAVSNLAAEDFAAHAAVTDMIVESLGDLLRRPSLSTLVYTCERIIHPTPVFDLLSDLVDLLAEIERFRLRYVSEARRALQIHAEILSDPMRTDQLPPDLRKRVRLLGSEKRASATRVKYFALSTQLRKADIHHRLSVDPRLLDSELLLSLHFPAPHSRPRTPSNSSLSEEESQMLVRGRLYCESLIQEISTWARDFHGTDAEAKAYFEATWPLDPPWCTLCQVMEKYMQEVQDGWKEIKEIFPEAETPPPQPKIEPLDEDVLKEMSKQQVSSSRTGPPLEPKPEEAKPEPLSPNLSHTR